MFTPPYFPTTAQRVHSLNSKPTINTDLNSYVHPGTYRSLREREDLDTEEKERRERQLAQSPRRISHHS